MITVKESILIKRTVEDVWDFTQDYQKRPSWDPSIVEASIVKSEPPRIAHVVGRGKWSAVFRYMLDDRPNKSSLVMEEVHSRLFAGGGGSWKYEPVNGMTRWEQTNTLILKTSLVARIFRSLIALVFRRQTRVAMQRAKRVLESTRD